MRHVTDLDRVYHELSTLARQVEALRRVVGTIISDGLPAEQENPPEAIVDPKTNRPFHGGRKQWAPCRRI